jgi:hypothetical protein
MRFINRSLRAVVDQLLAALAMVCLGRYGADPQRCEKK